MTHAAVAGARPPAAPGPSPLPPPLPLCVDLDGTLIRTDLLHEAAMLFVARHPLSAWRLGVWALKGARVLKHELAARVEIDARTLPYRAEVLRHIAEHRARGGAVHLVTASPGRWAHAVAAHLGLFDGVRSSSEQVNLKHAAKARDLVDRFGRGGFSYIGDGRHDVPVWAAAGEAVGAGRGAARYLAPDSHIFHDGESAAKAMFRALRTHQWLKNLLVFVPLLASHRIGDPGAVLAALTTFMAFCCCASSTYIVNDLLDLAADRQHPRKRERPFASGAAPIWMGVLAAPLLVVAAALFALATPPLVAWTLALYYALTLAYSATLKRRAPADVFTLAGLYTVRVVAGAVATGVVLSLWLAACSIFLFLSLATLKRHAELVDAAARSLDRAAGRGYWTSDGPVLVALGVASGFSSVLVLTLYVTQPHVAGLYRTPALLWLVCPLLLYWIARMWLLAQRRQMHDDPIVMAARDPVSRIVIALCAAIALAATTIALPVPMIVG